jgi:CheY-like chemotaxis protein
MTPLLVVDDAAGFRSVLTPLFPQSGSEVHTTDDGDDGDYAVALMTNETIGANLLPSPVSSAVHTTHAAHPACDLLAVPAQQP